MREILFRGKTDNKWVYGVPIYLRKEAYIVRDFCLGGSYTDDWVEAETIGQFTGLTDKNGKKIFEGDIVEVTWKGNIICVGDIRYDEQSCRFVIYEDYVFPYGFDNTNTFEVIGNIHDNPELLGE